ncbi:MAG: hypothetical protein V1710_00780 [Candidatus Bathyarchaeota archaeon]
MINKETKILTLFIILLNAATVAGYVLAEKPQTDQCWPYIDPEIKIAIHEWARNQAVDFLKITPMWEWTDTDITPTGVYGTSMHQFVSGDITVQVSYNLNPTADYFVDVTYLGQSWNLRVSQMGECTLIN